MSSYFVIISVVKTGCGSSTLPAIMSAAYLVVLLVLLVHDFQTECAPTVAKITQQNISSKPGYIPVYIRNGNTPLEDINPDLAEAFNSYAYKHNKVVDYTNSKNKLNHEEAKEQEEKNVILNT